MFDCRDLVIQLGQFIPCEDCKSEWYAPEPTQNLLDWSRELHNKVNNKLGRYASWDDTDLHIAHKSECDICIQKEFVHRFPWDFIIAVASQPNSVDFLKAFNAKYPCEVHRGTFLDEPNPDETSIQWAVRNRQKVDPEFVMPSVSDPPMIPCSDCPAS
jgi:hypothetical protein